MIETENHTLHVGHISKHSSIYGPGIRYVIWTQGCTLACKGCWNTQFWPQKGGKSIGVNELVEEILSVQGVEGITLLGGEPLQQADATLELIQSMKRNGLTVFLYTGYSPDEFDETMQACYDNCDIVVSGRYVESLRDTNLRWRGSSNQKISCPTEKYSLEDLNEQNEIEFVVNEDGTIEMYGYPDDEIRAWVEGF
jgi:anaerobic ribonucleoside-triphosphate reductase activating protein|tara:strand:- start:1695 stop:2282 length:588 start_codon:yes stop_codon:yes gene_type:complete